MERIVVAYSGGLDTSVAIRWLAEQYGAEIVAVTLDIGQGRELADVGSARWRSALSAPTSSTRARSSCAATSFRRSRRARSTRTGIRSRRRWRGRSSPSASSRLRRMERATAVAHGCRGKGNDQVRLDVSARALDPDIKVIAPARMWDMSPAQVFAYAQARDLPVPPAVDEHLQHRCEPLGPIDRMRRARGPVGGAARRHLHADAGAAGWPGRTRLRRDRIRVRRAR